MMPTRVPKQMNKLCPKEKSLRLIGEKIEGSDTCLSLKIKIHAFQSRIEIKNMLVPIQTSGCAKPPKYLK